MNKLNIYSYAFVMIITAGAFCVWTANARADQSTSVDIEYKNQITNIVRAYFEARYRSFSTLKMESLDGLIDESLKGNSFKRSEFDKLEIEIDHARYYHLRYLQYEYFLDFKDISLNSFYDTATVYVVEGHNVEFEISREISGSEPIISKMRNLQHTIVLRKKNGVWKIVSDNYEDYLWRFINATGLSKKDLIQSNENLESTHHENDGAMIETTSCNLPSDQSIYSYNRNGAVQYAHQYATSHNPKYHYYSDNDGGDCTNFISQAIYEGGRALMVGTGTLGWYYNNVNDHSPSWTNVQYLYDFIVEPGYSYWPAGPEGCDTLIDQAEKGDVIQYNWKENPPGTPDPNDVTWDHSVIIVQSQYDPTFHWVAAHSEDIDGYPYTSFKYNHPNMITRFIHIVRLDGARLFIPLVRKNVTGMASQMQLPLLRPYPATLEEGVIVAPLPYPAPMEFSEPLILTSYPAP